MPSWHEWLEGFGAREIILTLVIVAVTFLAREKPWRTRKK